MHDKLADKREQKLKELQTHIERTEKFVIQKKEPRRKKYQHKYNYQHQQRYWRNYSRPQSFHKPQPQKPLPPMTHSQILQFKTPYYRRLDNKPTWLN